VDERIPIDGFRFGTALLCDLVDRWTRQEEKP
jgi:hypothetical protein